MRGVTPRLDADSLACEIPSLFTDHAAMVRRILPRMARRLADGALHTYWPEHHCLARTNRHEWPTPQADAIRELAEAA